MASFAFMDIEKIKTEGTMTSKYIHNTRKIQIDNVIPELSDKNETLVALPKINGKELNYNEAFKDRLSTLDYYKEHNVRSNAVLGYEVLMTYSRDAKIDVEAWKKQSMDWLHKTFDVASDGRSNVLNAEFHADEVGNVHIHAIVVPIDERGRLNAKRFTDGSRAMSDLQTTYAESVADLGLRRGVAGSSANHKDIRRMYANLNNATVLPKVKVGETAEEYKERVMEQMKTAYASGMRQVDDYAVRRRQEMDEQFNEEKAAIERELMHKQKEAQKQVDKIEERKEELEQDVLSYEEMVETLAMQIAQTKKELEELEMAVDEEHNNENARLFYEDIQLGLDILEEDDPEEAKAIQEGLEHLQFLAEQRREEMAEQEEAEEEMLNESLGL